MKYKTGPRSNGFEATNTSKEHQQYKLCNPNLHRLLHISAAFRKPPPRALERSINLKARTVLPLVLRWQTNFGYGFGGSEGSLLL